MPLWRFLSPFSGLEDGLHGKERGSFFGPDGEEEGEMHARIRTCTHFKGVQLPRPSSG